ncbi:unnamed protein product [[Candida] boidinii]|uniref:Unnamed protein product n=1 Tax=Candida boidinii TaxID=5477 RepID=A0ACB5TTC8_CANBO|nr:unnamed protein product [[Candida] boidinii]
MSHSNLIAFLTESENCCLSTNKLIGLTSIRSIYTTVPRLQSTTSGDQKISQEIEPTKGEITPNDIVSGAPKELTLNRVVRIYKEAKYATQSGERNTDFWRIDWDVLTKGNRWENDMIGYQGSSDYMQGTRLNFDTKEAAIRFAEGQGYGYYLQEPKEKKFKKKQYATNFLHSTGPLKHIRTK